MDGFDIEDKSTVGTAALATQRNDGRTRWIANVGRSTCHGTTNNTGSDSRAEDISSTGNCGETIGRFGTEMVYFVSSGT